MDLIGIIGLAAAPLTAVAGWQFARSEKLRTRVLDLELAAAVSKNQLDNIEDMVNSVDKRLGVLTEHLLKR
jgi:hypothetical protein